MPRGRGPRRASGLASLFRRCREEAWRAPASLVQGAALANVTYLALAEGCTVQLSIARADTRAHLKVGGVARL